MPAFDCEAQCQAPDSFFSGYPWAINPKGGSLIVRPGKKFQLIFCYLLVIENKTLKWQSCDLLGERNVQT